MGGYQQRLEQFLESAGQRRPSVLVHACCAPCASYVMEYLSRSCDLTFYFCNPNMDTEEEYCRRAAELERLAAEMPTVSEVRVVRAVYDRESFCRIAAGLEDEPERGRRCLRCYELRLRKTALFLKQSGRYECFTTTLTLSPLKSADAVNEIGERVAAETGTVWLPSDFKKKNGYLRSLELSREYGLYRQAYCGCVFSRRQREIAKHAD